MADLKRLAQLKDDISDARREADRASGALEGILQELEKEFGVKSLEEGKKLLDELQSKVKKSERKYEKALRRFEKRWGKALR